MWVPMIHSVHVAIRGQRGASLSFYLVILGIVFGWPDMAASALTTGPSHQPLVSLGIKAKNET